VGGVKGHNKNEISFPGSPGLCPGSFTLAIFMNICIITSSFPSHPNDFVQAPFLLPFIEGLKRRGHKNFIFTQDREEFKKDFLAGVVIKRFPWRGSKRPIVHLNFLNPGDGLRMVSLFYQGRKSLLPFIKEHKIDACLALWVLPGGYFANYVYRRTGVPYSVWALGSDIYRYGENPFLYPTLKRIIHEAKGVFADGFDLSRRVEERFGRKCHFLATTRNLGLMESIKLNGLDKLNEPNRPNKLNEPNQPYRFLFVGRLEKVKGFDLLLESMTLLTAEKPAVHLDVVGGGTIENWAENLIERKGLRRWVALQGKVDDSTLASLYATSDCVVIPSRSESIPLVFSEALRFNRDLIVTDVGDMGILGRDYGVAVVVPPEDPMALKEAMKRKVGFQKREQGRREELLKLFNIETSVEGFLADYK
jgi:glycosyltransferase involved in cell wall biosynthesis